jgi:hypothetical protein
MTSIANKQTKKQKKQQRWAGRTLAEHGDCDVDRRDIIDRAKAMISPVHNFRLVEENTS